MAGIIKNKYGRGVQNSQFGLVDFGTGEVIDNKICLNEAPKKFEVKGEFIKIYNDYDEMLESLVGGKVFMAFHRLCSTCQWDGEIYVKVLERVECYRRATMKLKKMRENGLIRKINKKWYVNPYLCHKGKNVTFELAKQFPTPKILFNKL